ncbi:unnamed protein product, partial [Cuscuta europaea]
MVLQAQMVLMFPLKADSSFEAELEAMRVAMNWAIDKGYIDFQVEFDSVEVLNSISRKPTGKWKGLIDDILVKARRAGVSFGQVMRQANWPAHYLAGIQVA